MMLPAAALAEVATLADGPVSGTVVVDDNWTLAYTVEDGEATIDYAENYPESTADLAIPESVPDPDGGEEVPVTGIGEDAFNGNTAGTGDYQEGSQHLAAVTLPGSVRYIEEEAFKNTNKKLTVKVPKAKTKKYSKLFAKAGIPRTAKITA